MNYLANKDLSDDSHPRQVRRAFRAMVGCESYPVQDEDNLAPDRADGVSQHDEEAINEEPDTRESELQPA